MRTVTHLGPPAPSIPPGGLAARWAGPLGGSVSAGLGGGGQRGQEGHFPRGSEGLKMTNPPATTSHARLRQPGRGGSATCSWAPTSLQRPPAVRGSATGCRPESHPPYGQQEQCCLL